MSKNQRAKRKHLKEDIRAKGYRYVLERYDTLPNSFYKVYLPKIIDSQRGTYMKVNALCIVMRHKVLNTFSLNIVMDLFNSIVGDKDLKYEIYMFWRTFESTQKFSELFFLENIDKIKISNVSPRLNQWVKEENQSDELKVLLMLRN
jgi:hypothetical protein